MKALTLWEPWATLVAIGAKRWETRGWSTKYRGPLAIHAALCSHKRSPKHVMDAYHEQMSKPETIAALGEANAWPNQGGVFLAVVDLVDVVDMFPEGGTVFTPPSDREKAFGIWGPGRFALKLENLRPLVRYAAKGAPTRILGKLIEARGRQLLWNPSPEVLAQITAALAGGAAA